MKSRTSFFNGTVLRKDITRFAPVWALYTVFLVILFMTAYLPDRLNMARDVLDIIGTMSLVNLIYGGLCANLLFGDLFNARMCNALHTMPLRREGWFFTHAVAGLLFCIVPNIAGSLFLMVMLQEYCYMALLWLAVMVLQFLFFFGVGTFSVMCAGNRLGMAAVYMIIHFFSQLVFLLVDQLYIPLLYGVAQTADVYKFFSPVYQLMSEDYVRFTYDSDRAYGWIDLFYMEQWYYLFGVAVIGAALMGLSILLYRKRKIECAGDLLALRPLEPVFLVICTLACGVFLYAISDVFGFAASYFLMAIGVLVGFFAGKMLLERTVRVFRKKNILVFGVFALVLAVSLFATKMDPLGITWYQPEAEEIAFMRVYEPGSYSEYGDPEAERWQLESPEEIEAFRQVHSQLMAERSKQAGDVPSSSVRVEILYGLKDGSTVTRYYDMDETSAAFETVRAHFSDYRYIFGTADYVALIEHVKSINMNLFGDLPSKFASQSITDPERIAQFMEALKLDCDAGNMAPDYVFHEDEESLGWFHIDYSTMYSHKNAYLGVDWAYADITVYPSATHTQALLDEWLEEYIEAQPRLKANPNSD